MPWLILIALLLAPLSLVSQEGEAVGFPAAGYLRLDEIIHPERHYAEIVGETRRVIEAPEIVGQFTLPVDEDGAIRITADLVPPIPDAALGLRVQYHYTPASPFDESKRRAYLFLAKASEERFPLQLTPLGIPTATAEVQFQTVLPVEQSYTTPPVQIPPSAVLGFACGLHQEWRDDNDSGARFVVEANNGDDWQVLHESVVEDYDIFESTTWKQHRVDLSAYAGQNLRLRFSSQGLKRSPKPQFSFPLWGNVQLYTQSPASDKPQPNVLLICLDTLRADHLGAYGYERNTSPSIDRLAEESILFEQAIAPAPWTTPTHASIFTGYHPRVHQAGVVAAGYHLAQHWTTLAERFREAGYLTAAFTEGVAIRGQMGFSQGFDRYSDGPDPVSHFHGKSPITFGAAADWIEAHHEQPFFLFVHTYEAHAPYGAIEPWRHLYADPDFEPDYGLELGNAENADDRRHIVNLYDAGIAYTDAQLGQFLQRLRELNVFDDTLILLFSDHGEEFWEHGAQGHTTHLYDEVLHVPLLIRLPRERSAAARVGEQVGLIDIFATVLDVAGLPAPDDDDSVSLLPLLRQDSGYERETVHSEFIYDASGEVGVPGIPPLQTRESIRTDRLKYLRYSDVTAPEEAAPIAEEAYDLDQDPQELEDLLATDPQAASELAEALQRFRAEKEAIRARHEGAQPQRQRMTPEDVEALRGLGYF